MATLVGALAAIVPLHDALGIQLISGVENVFNAMRAFLHFCLEWAFYRWLAYLVDCLFYLAALLLSVFTPVVPHFPHFAVPGWLKDAALGSIVILRAFETSYIIVPRDERDGARAITTAAQWDMIRRAQGPFLKAIHDRIENFNRRMYDVTDWLTLILTAPTRWAGIDPNNPVNRAVKKVVRELFAGVLMIGYIRVMGYLFFTVPAWNVDAPWPKASRKTFVYFLIALTAALLVATCILLGLSDERLAFLKNVFGSFSPVTKG